MQNLACHNIFAKPFFRLLFSINLLVVVSMSMNCSSLRMCLVDADCQSSQKCQKGRCGASSVTHPGVQDPTNSSSCPTSCQQDSDCTKKGCSDSLRCFQSKCQPSEQVYSVPSNKVDLLFVLDNSGSMKPKLELLQKYVSVLVKDLQYFGLDIQAGAISTDMSNPAARGRLLRSQLVNFVSMKDKALPALQQILNAGTQGSSYEKGLDSLKAALTYASDAKQAINKGLLRENSLLAIFLLTDEDDCSNSGNIPESEWPSDVCYFPKKVVLTDGNGSPLLDAGGKKIHGQMEELKPVKSYIDFLHSLQRTVVISGLIGSPILNTSETSSSFCTTDADCQSGGQKLFCGYPSVSRGMCGGCGSQSLLARPGIRYFELLKAFGDFGFWAPICGKDDVFSKGMESFANQILQSAHALFLHAPLSDLSKVTVSLSDGSATMTVRKAPSQHKSCTLDKDCEGQSLCGAQQQCMGKGWVYYPPINEKAKARIRFSGGVLHSSQTNFRVRVQLQP